MLTVSEFAAKHGITTQRVYQLISQKRLSIKVDKGVKLVTDKKLPTLRKAGRPSYRSRK